MNDLDRKILNLNSERKSLREIGTILNMSHEAVRKRLKAIEDKDQVSTNPEDQLTASPIENEEVSTGSKAHKSRTSEESEVGVNLIPQVGTPSQTPTEGVNPSPSPSRSPEEDREKVSLEACTRDLAGAIRQFLQENGAEVYEMTTSVEGFQARQGKQIVRFYVQRERSE